MGVYLFPFTSATKLHFFLGVFLHFITGDDSKNGQADVLLQAGNITLNCASFEVSSPYGSFRLPNKEYQMLEMLLRSPSSLIPAERFFEIVWGYDSDAEINVIWVHISRLRKKLAELQADVEIAASRNAGYYLKTSKAQPK